MKKPLPVSSTWNSSGNSEQVHMSVPGANKKFKRKSREPKRLFTETMTTFPVDVSDSDSVDDQHMVTRNVSMLAPLQRQLMMSQEVVTNSRGVLSGLPEDDMAPGQSGAIDMRIGINVPANGARVSQSPESPSSNHEISHWHPSISQPLSSRLKMGLPSTFPLSTSGSGACSPDHQAFLLDHGLPDPRASQSSQCLERMEVQLSPKDSPRKRAGIGGDGRGHLPEVKAIQQTRRLLANARERTRVHTISAAFEALRKQVPCYSYGQKLSKLAILRIACNYILSLAQLAELDYSPDHGSVSFSQCVDQCTRTLQAEGRSKKRKE
ncbi:transcription factor atoh8 [Cololabis saira]|uniref:transcription factor atoh8 n=1 Tax=Cololabis saira TaxID=129043 RepID=UPI002AD49280|nr:transcription factor atoh8 [Cololabis saira]